MSSTSSQELAASRSGSKELECEPSRSARASRSVVASSEGIGRTSPVTRMLEPSLPTVSPQMELLPMSFVAASHVRTSVLRERVPDLTEIGAGSGSSTPELLANFDHASSSWRTSQRCLIGGWETFSEPWPRSGTMRSGIAYQRQPLVPYTPEIAHGLLPTPNATAFKGGRLSPRLGKANPERNNFQDFCSLVLGMRYPLPEFTEPIMGFSRGWTYPETAPLETQSTPRSQKSSGAQS